MKITALGAVCAVACIVSVTAEAQIRLPAGAQIAPNRQLPPGFGTPDAFRPLPLTCQVDPAIRSVTLTKGSRPGQVRISYEVANLGRSAWASAPGQQGVQLVARNANTGGEFTHHQAVAGRAAPGAVMARFASPMIANAFDDFEFGGHVDVSIGYDPDIVIDGNACNDDSNAANNRLRIDNGAILGFMRGTARSQTFR
jgi:hypothetical protein